MKNRKLILTALFIGLSSPCVAEPMSIAEIKKEYQQSLDKQILQDREEYFRYGVLGFKSIYHMPETVYGNEEYNFFNITIELELLNGQSTICRKKKEHCIKTTDFTNFQTAIELTRKYYEILRKVNVESEAITSYNELTLKPKDFLKYIDRTDNIMYLYITIYYKNELETDYVDSTANNLISTIKRETRKYLNELSNLIKESSKRRILGLNNKNPYYYFKENNY